MYSSDHEWPKADRQTAHYEFRQALWMGALFSYQTSFLQLPRNEIEAHANFFRRFSERMQSLRTTWEQNRDTFHPDFAKFMDENVFNGC
jgi:hypothetical protein